MSFKTVQDVVDSAKELAHQVAAWDKAIELLDPYTAGEVEVYTTDGAPVPRSVFGDIQDHLRGERSDAKLGLKALMNMPVKEDADEPGEADEGDDRGDDGAAQADG